MYCGGCASPFPFTTSNDDTTATAAATATSATTATSPNTQQQQLVLGTGEVVFSTALTGYVQTLTDPSFKGQILVLTYPLIGNYGVRVRVPNATAEDELQGELCSPYLAPYSHESHHIQVAGVIVSSLTDAGKNDRNLKKGEISLTQWLRSQNIPVITNIDTRALTQYLTKHGSVTGMIQKSSSIDTIDTLTLTSEQKQDKKLSLRNKLHALQQRLSTINHVQTLRPTFSRWSCSPASMSSMSSMSSLHQTRILVVDLGMKHSIVRSLLNQNLLVQVVPYTSNLKQEMLNKKYHGLVISNGPGDPTKQTALIQQLRDVLINVSLDDPFYNLPVLGICLGFQLLALALNNDINNNNLQEVNVNGELLEESMSMHSTMSMLTTRITKLKFGHRGFNHPVVAVVPFMPLNGQDRKEGYITSQNHGYSVELGIHKGEEEEAMASSSSSSSSLLDAEWIPWFTNLHDNSSAGMHARNRPIMAVQFHPEGGGGPWDTKDLIFGTFQKLATAFHFRPGSNPLPVLSSWPPQRKSETEKTTPNLNLNLNLDNIRTVVVLGSGGIMIGQAGEFDYAGTQCLKTLRMRGIRTILINPNVASSQTMAGIADVVHFVPLEPDSVEEVLMHHEDIDGILLSFGGQTALNVGLELHDRGVLEKRQIRVLGTSIEGIAMTEDRQLFKDMLERVGNVQTATSTVVTTLQTALKSATQIGYPVLVRRAFALGGLGSAFANNATELERVFRLATVTSDPNGKSAQVILDKSLRGWKEIEYDVMRDQFGNTIVVCNMENLDPVGVHTGESIVVAPSQTLDDHTYQILRTASLNIANEIGIVGECNIQFALNPNPNKENTIEMEYTVIEVNPRLSRSSALASKATGYPIASIATELSLGSSLTELRNPMTGTSSALFEPALDYVVVKIPRWDFQMFGKKVSKKIATGMKSIGEVMGIGRTFSEALQKSIRMVSGNRKLGFEKTTTKHDLSLLELKQLLGEPGEHRLGYICHAFALGMTVNDISKYTHGMHVFFLSLLKETYDVGEALRSFADDNNNNNNNNDNNGGMVPDTLLLNAKRHGFSDKQIAQRLHVSEMEIRERRLKRGIVPSVKKIDTTAAEFEAQSSYLYLTYADVSLHSHSLHSRHYANSEVSDSSNSVDDDDSNMCSYQRSIVVLGSGVYRVGASVEFDSAVVECLRTIRDVKKSVRTVVINHNPETVSTDYDESDALYFEELSFERILDIIEIEQNLQHNNDQNTKSDFTNSRLHSNYRGADTIRRTNAVDLIVTMGGQASQNVVPLLATQDHVHVLGTSPHSIERAENRMRHSHMLETIQVQQPQWCNSTHLGDLLEFAQRVQYPVLARPSFVLAGAAMQVIHDATQLEIYYYKHTTNGANGGEQLVSKYPMVLSKVYTSGKEIDVDVVGRNGNVVVMAISEHVEDVGVHSGDATLVHPTIHLSNNVLEQIENIATNICKELNITGLFNLQIIQVLSNNNNDNNDNNDNTDSTTVIDLRVIETNVRASRSIPFVSKSTGISFINEATRAILNVRQNDALLLQSLRQRLPSRSLLSQTNNYAVKAAMFSFDRLPGADVLLGVTMKSTGEVAAFSTSPHVALLRAMRSAKRLFPPPPGMTPSLLNHESITSTTVLPHQCPSPLQTQSEPNSPVLCVAVRDLVFESAFVVTNDSGLFDLIALFDEMIAMGYQLAQCSIIDIDIDIDTTTDESQPSFGLFSSRLKRVSMSDASVVGFIDVCADGSLCYPEAKTNASDEESDEESDDDVGGYRGRRMALDLNLPLFTDLRVVEASVAAWKEIQSNCKTHRRMEKNFNRNRNV
jgi:carbamoyl-phosphate synthase small subunit